MTLNPVVNSGTKTATTPGNIGIFINGVVNASKVTSITETVTTYSPEGNLYYRLKG